MWTEIRIKNCENDIGTIYLSPLPCLTNRNAEIVAFVTYKILYNFGFVFIRFRCYV